MNRNLVNLVRKYRKNGVIVDTNLLLVLLAGNVQRGLVGKVARTDEYTVADYEMITNLLVEFDSLILVSPVLTEIGFFLEKNNDQAMQTQLYNELVRMVLDDTTRESRVYSDVVVEDPDFGRLGYADVAILKIAEIHHHLIFTADSPLHVEAGRRGIGVLPYDWLRNG